MVSPSRISRAAVQALKKESFICEPMSAPSVMRARARQRGLLRKTILTKRVDRSYLRSHCRRRLHSPALCRVLGRGVLSYGNLGNWVLRGISERVNARVVHPGRPPALVGTPIRWMHRGG